MREFLERQTLVWSAQYAAFRAAYPTVPIDYRETVADPWDPERWEEIIYTIICNYGEGSNVHRDTVAALNDAAPNWIIQGMRSGMHPSLREYIGNWYQNRMRAQRYANPAFSPYEDLVTNANQWFGSGAWFGSCVS